MADESPPEVPAPAEVEPGLWTCAEAAVPAALADASLGITHLVSIGYPPPDDPTGGVRAVETLRLELEDEEDGDLLTQIPDTVAFIRAGLSARLRGSPPGETSGAGSADAPGGTSLGGVLVHCHAGQSRSVAVAMAHVMRSRGLDVEEALRLVRVNNKNASPNAGFIAQLALWSSMDCKLNMADEAYRTYVVAKMFDELLLLFFVTLVIAAVVFYAVNLSGSFALFWLVYYVTLANGVVLAYLISALSPNMEAANAILPTYVVTLLFFAGFLIRPADTPEYWKWYAYVDLMKFSWGALMINQWKENDPEFVSGVSLLTEYDLKGESEWAYVGYLCVFFVAFFVAAFLALKHVNHSKR